MHEIGDAIWRHLPSPIWISLSSETPVRRTYPVEPETGNGGSVFTETPHIMGFLQPSSGRYDEGDYRSGDPPSGSMNYDFRVAVGEGDSALLRLR